MRALPPLPLLLARTRAAMKTQKLPLLTKTADSSLSGISRAEPHALSCHEAETVPTSMTLPARLPVTIKTKFSET